MTFDIGSSLEIFMFYYKSMSIKIKLEVLEFNIRVSV